MKCLYEPIGSLGSGQWKSTHVLHNRRAASSGLQRRRQIWLWILSRVSLSADPLSLSSLFTDVPLTPSPWCSHSCRLPHPNVCHSSLPLERWEKSTCKRWGKCRCWGSRKPLAFPSCLSPFPPSSSLSSSPFPREMDLVLHSIMFALGWQS